MTATPPPPVSAKAAPGPSGPVSRMPRRLRWLLIGSLTLNLLVVGAMAGSALRFAGDRPPPPGERSLAFGPWSGGLQREDYRALSKGFAASGRDLRTAWREEREDRAALVAGLRAEPFDPGVLDTLSARMRARALDRMDLGQSLIRDHILAMTPEARRAFADRLEQHMNRPRERGGRAERPEGPRD